MKYLTTALLISLPLIISTLKIGDENLLEKTFFTKLDHFSTQDSRKIKLVSYKQNY